MLEVSLIYFARRRKWMCCAASRYTMLRAWSTARFLSSRGQSAATIPQRSPDSSELACWSDPRKNYKPFWILSFMTLPYHFDWENAHTEIVNLLERYGRRDLQNCVDHATCALQLYCLILNWWKISGIFFSSHGRLHKWIYFEDWHRVYRRCSGNQPVLICCFHYID
jgi:hypothetical protein